MSDVQRVAVMTMSMGGGIAQFTAKLAATLCELGYETHVFCPYESSIVLGEGCVRHSYRYITSRNLIWGGSREWRRVCDEILSLAPAVLINDGGRMGVKAMQLLRGRVRTLLVIHDVNPHPSNGLDLKVRTKRIWDDALLPNGPDIADDVLLLSHNSFTQFADRYPRLRDKAHLMLIGAHPVKAEPVVPPELGARLGESGYLLFFGRIDKYKGMGRMLRAYHLARSSGAVLPLVIAGKGALTEEESKLSHEGGVTLVNRFVTDGEMSWLFAHASAVVLPYIEASQSGVLVMAYHFGKPVVCSDVPGLSEFVDDGETGVLCADDGDLAQAMLQLSVPGEADSMRDAIRHYAVEHLDWHKNVARLMRELGIVLTSGGDA